MFVLIENIQYFNTTIFFLHSFQVTNRLHLKCNWLRDNTFEFWQHLVQSGSIFERFDLRSQRDETIRQVGKRCYTPIGHGRGHSGETFTWCQPRLDRGAEASWEEDLPKKHSGNKSNLFAEIILSYLWKITLDVLIHKLNILVLIKIRDDYNKNKNLILLNLNFISFKEK